MLSRENFEDIHEFIATALPFNLVQFPSAEELVAMTRRDKKMVGTQLNLILLSNPGDLRIYRRELDAALISTVNEYLENFNVYGQDH